jgi:hypothetical protein
MKIMVLLHAAHGMEIWLKLLDQSCRRQKYMCLCFPVLSMRTNHVEELWCCQLFMQLTAFHIYIYIYYIYTYIILQVSLLRTLRSLKHRLAAGEC